MILLPSLSVIVMTAGFGEEEGTPGGVSRVTSKVSSPSRARSSLVIRISSQAMEADAGIVMSTVVAVKSSPADMESDTEAT